MLLLPIALTACASTAGIRSAMLPPGARYVAMGSSFAAGPGLGRPRPGTPPRCMRDLDNYPTVLATRLGLDLVDVTCSGAITANLLRPWSELPAQLDALSPDTRLVTITIGGNDVDYVRSLYLAACNTTAARACPPVTPPAEEAWALLEKSLRRIVADVSSRSPQAQLVFVNYVTLVPAERTCPAVPLRPAVADTVRNIAMRLAALTAKVARSTGSDLIDAGGLSAHHTACDPDPWSAGAPGTGPGAPWHPNTAGMRHIADALAMKITRR